MGDDEDDPGPSAREILFDDNGGFRWRRLVDAVRGSDATPFLPDLLVGLVAAIVLALASLAGLVELELLLILALLLFLYAFIGGLIVIERVKDYYSEDEEVAIEELRSRYADGDLALQEFQRRVDMVYERGAETVWEEDEGRHVHDRDPADILQERFARGEIDEAEYRRRMEVLGEPVEGVATERVAERET